MSLIDSDDEYTNKQTKSLLSVVDLLKPKTSTKPTKALKSKANIKRSKGELFASEEQLGTDKLAVNLANLNQAMHLKQGNTANDDEDFIVFNNSDDDDDGEEGSFNVTDLFAMHEQNDKKTSKKSTKQIDSTPTTTLSSGKLSVSSLLSTLQSTQSKNKAASGNSLQQQLLSSLKQPSIYKLEKSVDSMETHHAKVTAPALSSFEKSRIERQSAYQAKSQDISKFDGIVQHHRQTEQRNFAKENKALVRQGTSMTEKTLTHSFNPTTDLEHELNDLLTQIGIDNTKAQQLEKQQQLLALERHETKEEYLEKQKYLAKMKLMAYYEQQRQHRIAKIKSRQQRRYLRRQKDKLRENQLLDEDGKLRQDLDPEELKQLEEEHERTRVRERALLKHKNMGDWAKRQQRVSRVNNDARRLLQEQLNLGKELRQKLGHKEETIDDDDALDSLSEASDTEEQNVLKGAVSRMSKEYNDVDYHMKQLSKAAGGDDKGSGLFHLPFMKRAAEQQRLQNQEALRDLQEEMKQGEEDSSDEEGGRRHAAEYAKKLGQSSLTSSQLGKKSFGPNSTQSGPAPSDNEDSAIKGSSKPVITKGLLSGGVFDVDFDDMDENTAMDNNTAADIKTIAATATYSEHNLEAQAAQRQRILDSMRTAKEYRQQRGLDDTNYIPQEAGAESPKQPESVKNDDNSDDSGDDEEVLPPVDKIKTGINSDDDDDEEEEEEAPNLDDVLAMSSDDENDDTSKSAWLSTSSKGDEKKKSKKQSIDDNQVMVNMQDSLLLSADRDEQRREVSIEQQRGEKDLDSELLDINLIKKDQKSSKAKTTSSTEDVDLVSLAFSTAAADDEDEAFQKYKLQEIEQDLPQENELITGVPGWGSWAGVEKSKHQLKREAKIRDEHKADIKAQRNAIMAARTDAHLKNVILTQKSDKKALKYQINHVPHPYRSIDEYQRAMSTPLGKEWNSHKSFTELTQKKIIVNAGQVVEPLRWKGSFATYTKEGDKAETVKEKEAIDVKTGKQRAFQERLAVKRKAEEKSLKSSNKTKKSRK